eukprot:TRINITY_DN2429_c0_g1_i1.p1 TRINITY_DN2429_c0_g1~~TRINITY_DN2429_c0_g1_i1.p1  ORF type:complete len:104 (-),score=24.76 TRINITY_DN2429_c0_g1_i1:32-343(-)
MNFVGRRATKTLSKNIQRRCYSTPAKSGKKKFEIDPDHAEWGDLQFWKMATFVGLVPILGIFFTMHEDHGESPGTPPVRSKAFPWGDGETALIEHIGNELSGK